MKLAIVGSKTFTHYPSLIDWVVRTVEAFGHPSEQHVIVSGGAHGADTMAKECAYDYDYEYLEFPAEWDKCGKSAGFRRNKQIVDACDIILAFWDGKSKGTEHTISLAKKAKKPTFIIYF